MTREQDLPNLYNPASLNMDSRRLRTIEEPTYVVNILSGSSSDNYRMTVLYCFSDALEGCHHIADLFGHAVPAGFQVLGSWCLKLLAKLQNTTNVLCPTPVVANGDWY